MTRFKITHQKRETITKEESDLHARQRDKIIRTRNKTKETERQQTKNLINTKLPVETNRKTSTKNTILKPTKKNKRIPIYLSIALIIFKLLAEEITSEQDITIITC